MINFLPDPFPWSAIASTLLSVVLSFGGFVIGIRAGKNNRDRGYLRDIYKSIFSHLREMKESIIGGKPMQWENFRMGGNGYIPPVKELEVDGTINALPEALAKRLVEVEQATLFNNWQWKKMIEDSVGPEIQMAFRERNSGDAKTVRHQSFWVQRLFNLSEYLAHLVGFIMQRVCCVASAGFRVSFV